MFYSGQVFRQAGVLVFDPENKEQTEDGHFLATSFSFPSLVETINLFIPIYPHLHIFLLCVAFHRLKSRFVSSLGAGAHILICYSVKCRTD